MTYVRNVETLRHAQAIIIMKHAQGFTQIYNIYMRTLKESILSTTKVGKYDEWNTFKRENAHPKRYTELLHIIVESIKLKGPSVDLNWIDISKIPSMSSLFYGIDFNGDISKWDVSKVKSMRNMFQNSDFNKDISKWDVRNVEAMSNMFRYSPFSYDLRRWNIKSIRKYIDVIGMFDGTPLEIDPPEWYKKLGNSFII